MDEDELDPRIQVELEKLNSATDVINKLEIELDEANTTFRMLLNECTRRLKVHSSKHGSSIENARPYYEALDIARHAQQECQQAAVSFQRANEVHEAAKETVALAESRFMSQQPEWRFDSAWQEMLNHATIKVRDAEKQRAESSSYHSQATAKYKDAQEKVHMLEQRLRRNVAKSRPYFEEKQRCNEQLAAQKEAVEALAAKVARVKSEYAESLRRLEGISEEIHRKRGNMHTGGCGVREPGVGAELEYKGELDHCDISREKAFDKIDYDYDAKYNTNSLPDVDLDKETNDKSNSTVHNTKSRDDVIRGTASDGKTWVDVDLRHDADNSGNVQTTRLDTRRDVLGETMPDNQTSSDVDNKLSFDSLHGVHFNPIRELRRERPIDSGALSEEVATLTDLRKDVLPGIVCPPVVATDVGSSVSQGKNGLRENKDEGDIDSDVVKESKVDASLHSESFEAAVEDEPIVTCDKLQEQIVDGVVEKNGAKDINSVIVEETGHDTTETTGYYDFQSVADTSLTCNPPQVKSPQTSRNILQEKEGAKSGDLGRKRTSSIVDVDDFCSQGDAGNSTPVASFKIGDDNLPRRMASEIESGDSLAVDSKTKATIADGDVLFSRPADGQNANTQQATSLPLYH